MSRTGVVIATYQSHEAAAGAVKLLQPTESKDLASFEG
jgi:hypothetical protein